MRVMLTTDTIGGVWTFTRELSEGLLQAGHVVALVSFGRAPSPEQNSWTEKTAASFRNCFAYWPSSAPLEWMQDNNHSLSVAGDTLLTLASQFKPDIFHSNQFCFGSLRLAIPKLITAHSDVLSWAAACRPPGLDSSSWLIRYCALVQAGLNGADAVTAPTNFMLNALLRNFQVPRETSIIVNGRTLIPAHSAPPRQRQAISVGRLWDEAKGLSTLLKTCSPVPVLIAGEQAFEEALVRPDAPHVKFLGLKTEEELISLFRQSSVYVVTSLYEPFGLAPLEAALCGCAIVARNLPSLREVWSDSAIYFDTAAELASCLQKLFMSEEQLQARQSAAQRRAEVFTSERMTSSYLSLYEKLISGAGSRMLSHQEPASHAA